MVVQAAKQRASSLLSYGGALVDQVAPPDTRAQIYDNVSSFTQTQPYLSTFLFLQLALSFLPLLLFTSFFLGTVILSALAALAFSAFWIGLALLVLVPTLFVTVSIATCVWVWAVGSYLTVMYTYDFLYSRGYVGKGAVQVKVKTPSTGKEYQANAGDGY